MTITAFSGPLVTYNHGDAYPNTAEAPSVLDQGSALLDPRAPYGYKPGSFSYTGQVYGTGATGLIPTVDAYLYPAGPANLAAAQALTAGVPMTLVSSSSLGVTVGVNVQNILTGAAILNTIALDSYNTVYNPTLGVTVANCLLPMGQSGAVTLLDPTTSTSRRLIFTGTPLVTNTLKVTGVDIYGYVVTEDVHITIGANGYTRKAYKFLISVVPQFSDAATMSVGTLDQFGYPLRLDYNSECLVFENEVLQTTTTVCSALYKIASISAGGPGDLIVNLFGDPINSDDYDLPVGSTVTISRTTPASFNGTYPVAGTASNAIVIPSTNADTYVSGGEIFCSLSGNRTADVRGIYEFSSNPGSPFTLKIYQSPSLRNVSTSFGLYGADQYNL